MLHKFYRKNNNTKHVRDVEFFYENRDDLRWFGLLSTNYIPNSISQEKNTEFWFCSMSKFQIIKKE